MTQETPPIGTQELRGAMDTLRRYRAGKANLERRIIENEEFWRLRHWDRIPEKGTGALQTRSAWLVNVILSKHADAMDAYPEPNCLPREPGDEAQARLLSAILPVVLQQNDFELTWSDNWWKKLKAGFAIYGVFWDPSRMNGLGDVAIRKVDPLSLYWEPGICDLQRSRSLFHVELEDDDALLERYPELEGKLGLKGFTACRYLYDDAADVSGKSPVVDWYYKKTVSGRTVLHYVKFVGDTVLFATENDPAYAGGLYDHGLYPFFADVLFPEEGTPAGFGYVDLCKDAQRQIDLMNSAIVTNCIAAATPRWLKRGDDGVNEEEYADWTRPFVHVQGSIEENVLRPIPVTPLSGNYLSVLASKINEMKETSGNRDVSNGGTASGVTAASAIAAMQEQSGKLSRDQIQNSYRCFRQVVYCVISLIRQFYGEPRKFRILGEDGTAEYLRFGSGDVSALEPAALDIEVSAQRQTAYTKLSANELAMQFFRSGFFNPQLTDQALTALEMMDFKGKQALRGRLEQNETLLRRLEETTARYEALRDLIFSTAREAAPGRDGEAAPASDPGGPGAVTGPAPISSEAPARKSYDALGNELARNAIAEKARARAAAVSRPRER